MLLSKLEIVLSDYVRLEVGLGAGGGSSGGHLAGGGGGEPGGGMSGGRDLTQGSLGVGGAVWS